MVIEEIRNFDESQRTATATDNVFGLHNIDPMKLSWNTLIAMEPLVKSFLLRSTYNLLLNATNLKLWGYIISDVCT